MKKTWLVSAAFLALAMTACGGGTSSVAPSVEPSSEAPSVEPSSEAPAPSSEASTEAPSSESTSVAVVNHYVVGAFNGWVTKDADYLMTPDPEDKFHFTFEGLALKEGQGVKCCNDKGTWFPEGMGNDTVAPENGIYTVELHKTASESEMTTLVKTGDYEPEGDTYYYVVGSFNSWTAQDEDYLMSEDEEVEGGYIFEGLELTSGAALKVVDSDNAWHGGEDGGNVEVDEDGVYTVRYSEGLVTVEKTGEYDPGETSYYAVGSFNEWVPCQADLLLTVDEDDDNHYFCAYDLVFEEEAQVKVVSSTNVWYGDADGENVVVEAGTYRLDFYLEVGEGEAHVTLTPANAE